MFFSVGNAWEVRYITLLTSKSQTLNLMLYYFARYWLDVAELSRLAKYCVLNERGKFGAKIFAHDTVVVIFMFGHFILTHPVYCMHKYIFFLSICQQQPLGQIQSCSMPHDLVTAVQLCVSSVQSVMLSVTSSCLTYTVTDSLAEASRSLVHSSGTVCQPNCVSHTSNGKNFGGY